VLESVMQVMKGRVVVDIDYVVVEKLKLAM
jgi:hypothetical protein